MISPPAQLSFFALSPGHYARQCSSPILGHRTGTRTGLWQAARSSRLPVMQFLGSAQETGAVAQNCYFWSLPIALCLAPCPHFLFPPFLHYFLLSPSFSVSLPVCISSFLSLLQPVSSSLPVSPAQLAGPSLCSLGLRPAPHPLLLLRRLPPGGHRCSVLLPLLVLIRTPLFLTLSGLFPVLPLLSVPASPFLSLFPAFLLSPFPSVPLSCSLSHLSVAPLS